MSRWFRFYSDVVDDPKAQMLSPEMFKHWVNVLCIASKHDGELPAIAATAFILRLAEPKAAGILAKLYAAGLLDKTEKSFKPHNWDGRQFKSDKPDETAAERMRNYRERKRNAGHVTPSVTRNVTEDVTRNVTEDVTRNVTVPRAETETETDIVDAGDARASLVSKEALELADDLLVISGHDLDFVPPGWCGAGLRVQTWLSQGWHPEIIRAAVKSAATRKRGQKAYSVDYFQNAIAEEVARQSAPLPVVEVKPADKITVSKHAKTGTFDEAYHNVLDKLNAGFGGPAPEERLRVGAGETDARLLAYRRSQ